MHKPFSRFRWTLVLFGFLIFLRLPGASAQSFVKLNEVLASSVALTNAQGKVTDWVELVNTTPRSADLSGASLTDDPLKPKKWAFPAGTSIGPSSYLVVLLDGDLAGSTSPTAPLNAGFGLKASGDRLYFYAGPAEGGILIDSIQFGLQLSDLSIGRSPDGSGAWTLCSPSPGAANKPITLAPPSTLKVNEWMASPNSGDDWFEIYNPNLVPVALGGLFLTDTPNQPAQFAIAPLSYIGTEAEAYLRFFASGSTNSGLNHTNFKLAGSGESVGIYGPGGAKIDLITFGAQLDGVSQGRLPDGGSTIASFPDTSSPGDSNYKIFPGLVVNEILTHTDYPLEDAIEFYNQTANRIDISGWYLSNKRLEPKRYRIPANTFIEPFGFKVFYEGTSFNSPTAASPFTFNSAHGDEAYLFQADAAGNLTGYRLGEIFESAENGVSFGRYDTSVDYKFVAMSARTFGVDNPANLVEFRLGQGASNAYPKIGPIVINEIMYHPPNIGTNDNVVDEFIEFRNITSVPVPLYDPEYPTNRWRIQNTVEYLFPLGAVIPANAFFLAVSFDPTARGDLLAAFRTKYGVPGDVQIFGPYAGKLGNGSGPVELYKPDPVQVAPHPDAGYVPYIRADKVNYEDASPWPAGADGTGSSIQRKNSALFGNDPRNWQAASPTAGRANGTEVLDTDGDGMPDLYESSQGLNPSDPNDAKLDPDHDGFTNLQEYIAGTNPHDANSRLKIDAVVAATAQLPLKITFTAQAGKSYTVQYRNSMSAGSDWQTLKQVSAPLSTQTVEVQDANAWGRKDRYYRVVTPGTN